MFSDEFKDFIKPAYPDKNAISIVMAADMKYLKFAFVTLRSIINHSNKNTNYDVVILTDSISEKNNEKLSFIVKNLKNFTVRFYNMAKFIDFYGVDSFKIRGHFSVASYYRFFIPSIFCKYTKSLYLDCDLVVNSDVAEIFNFDLDDKYLAAVPSLGLINDYHNGGYVEYFKNTLKITQPNDYFNSGVMLFNNLLMLKDGIINKLMDKLIEVQQPLLVDQDIFNAVCGSNVFLMDQKYNLMVHILNIKTYSPNVPYEMIESLNEASKNPKIIHYTSSAKPWNTEFITFSDYFWYNARNTPFYEEILGQYFSNIEKNKSNKKFIRNVMMFYNLLRYSFLYLFTFGNRKLRYKKKLNITWG